MISIQPKLYDLEGGLVIDNIASSTDTQTVTRRVSRTPTLDGGATLFDSGYSDADRTFKVVIRSPTLEQVERAMAIIRNHAKVTIATSEACFVGTIIRGNPSQADFNLTIYIEARVSL